jgi:2'-5' RNA ligase
MKAELMHTISILKEHSIKGNFTRRENLHLTVAFIGEVATNRMEQLTHTMEKVSFDPFALELLDLGQFHNREEKLYYRNVTCPEELLLYRQRLVEELKHTHFPVDEKAFIPHITLGRRCVMKESFSKLTMSQLLQTKHMMVDEISLMKSEQINGTLTYSKLYGMKVIPM